MEQYQPISCDLHDYLEIACMHHYRLQIETTDGELFAAEALTIMTTADQQEFLLLEGADGQLEIRLDRLLAITALQPHASFGRVELNPERRLH
ncbi:MAG: Rho-binding antiterminator [Spongiibacteraceae bacterium]|jgi:Rho-binding antiterminator|nr:Rho-binding antiterminator [Spongiibacteraceae bacterium]